MVDMQGLSCPLIIANEESEGGDETVPKPVKAPGTGWA